MINEEEDNNGFANLKQNIQDFLIRKDFIQARNETTSILNQIYHFATMKDTKEMYVYNGGTYVPEGENVIHEQFCKLWGENAKAYEFREVVFNIQGRSFVDREDFNKDINIIPVKNGLLNIKTRKIEDFSYDKKYTLQLPVEYNPDATCPNIDKFMSEVFKPEDVPLAYEIISYCLWRDVPIQKGIMLLGGGRNGKSKYIGLIRHLLGEANISTRTIQDLCYNKFAPATLFGKLANLNADLPEMALKQTGNFKQLTDGDFLTYEKKHQDVNSGFKNYAKLIFAANKLPKTEDITFAFFDRWVIIECPNTFTGKNRDANILQKITTPEELSGLLNKCLTTLESLLDRGEFTPGSTQDIMKEYVRRSDSIRAYVMDKLVKNVEAPLVPRSEVYEKYCEYCEENDLAPETSQKFGRDLKVNAPWVKNCFTTLSGKRVKGYSNLGFVENIGCSGSSQSSLVLNEGQTTTNTTDITKIIKETIYNINEYMSKNGSIGSQNTNQPTPSIFYKVIEKISSLDKGEGVAEEIIRADFWQMLPEDFVNKTETWEVVINELKNKGKIYEPKCGFYKTTEET